MEPMEIAHALEAEFTTDVVEVTTFRDQVAVTVSPDKIGPICRWLHDEPRIVMDFLSDLCAVDFPERELRFEVVYNLYSIAHQHPYHPGWKLRWRFIFQERQRHVWNHDTECKEN